MPSLDNIAPKPMLRLGALCYPWGQSMGGCAERYTLMQERSTDIKPIQVLLGYNDIKTTIRYTQVSSDGSEIMSVPLIN